MGKILIVDDEPSIRTALREILEFEDYEVCEAGSGLEALEVAKEEKIILAFLDVKMPGMDGVETLEKIKEIYDFPIIMISAHATIDKVVEAIKKGAYDFISKPIDMNRLLISTRNAVEKVQLVNETLTLKKKIDKKYEIIGKSNSIHRIKSMIDKVAHTDARVMILGESGVGKELVAHWLHHKSDRATAPFVEVNCAAIPSELIESQLFGHEKGSFTSAIKMKKGDFELANGGTIFFDEIADMSLEAQAKVLRALQENKITRVGGEKDIPVNVRVIAATNKNLQEEIKLKRFREDLYHRLCVIVIQVPPLRERTEDISLLVRHFIDDISQNAGKPPRDITDEAIKELQSYPWTGNIRELRNVIERLLILCDSIITVDDVRFYTNRPLIPNN
ncbi:MAG TPA: sigma-54 dependent transcriptional regulator [Bacteroidales bacterium]|nr:sigma-54 dependent transcriptional regulator [Bacteroidales bacterium]